MAETIRLRVVTPSLMLIDEEVDEVTAPGALGEFGVLPNHIAFLTLLEAGEMSYKQGPNRYYLAVSGGYAEVLDNVMTILATAAEFPDEIDADVARRAGLDAETRISELLLEGQEATPAEAALRWAAARVAVAERQARREHQE